MAIEEIHLIHHTHADYGYTDLPHTCRKQLTRYLQQAVAIAERTKGFPEAARMRFTCEIAWQLRDFLQTASKQEVDAWNRLVDRGDFELGAMPFHTSALLEAQEWTALLDGMRPLYERYKPRTCFQNDINGLPWGLIPSLKERGVDYVMMGVNTYSGALPMEAPTGFWWEGPDGSRMLAWLSLHYCAAYEFLYPEEWRVGPVPTQDDVWFHAPEGRDTFDERLPALKEAHRHLLTKIDEKLGHYPHRTLGLQVTNMWRMDNDPPCEQLCHFVKAWNEAGLTPSLRLSTPTAFLSTIEQEAGDQLPVIRGDWGEWWADSVSSMPTETALCQRTKQLLADVPQAAARLQTSFAWEQPLREAWELNGFYTEHTFGSFDSLALPYGPLNLGNIAQVANYAYQADEDARNLRADIIRGSADYCRSSEARHITVFNPGNVARSDWVEFPAAALRLPANAVRDTVTGEEFELEPILAPVWSAPDASGEKPYEPLQDIFAFKPAKLRFFCPSLPAGEDRRFELIEKETGKTHEQHEASSFSCDWDETTGQLRSLKHPASKIELIDPSAEWGMAMPVFEIPQGFGAREELLYRRPCEMIYEVPDFIALQHQETAHGSRVTRIFEHPNCHRIEQQWDFLKHADRIEISTTFWLKETLEAQAIYLAFPFNVPDSKAYYYSLGHRTEVGRDQMANTCGEYQAVNGGVEFIGPDRSVALSTVDTPLGAFESIATRKGRTTFTPSNATFFSFVTENYWVTNFPHTRAAKVTVRHQIHCAEGQEHNLDKLSTGLWNYPS